MADKPKNIIEDIAQDFLQSALVLRYDICTCPTCKNDMLAYVLSRVPAKYVTTEQGALYIIIDQTRIERQAEIAREVIKAIDIISKNPRHEVKEDKGLTFEMLLNKIFTDRGLDFRHYHRELLKRRVAIRIRLNKLESYSDYLRFLIKNPAEYERLFEVLCINVSEFFRDTEIWITIKFVLENLVRQKTQKNEKTIAIWSAGCANGEEPYSIAILLKEIAQLNNPKLSLRLLASDLDRKSLRLAEAGDYPKEAVKNVEAHLLKRYFIPLNISGRYRLKEEIKNMVEFQYMDLVGEEFAKEFDIIVCRNVFIYFERSLQEQVLMKFYKSLNPGGYLILGKSEIILVEARQVFDEVDANARIYRKK